MREGEIESAARIVLVTPMPDIMGNTDLQHLEDHGYIWVEVQRNRSLIQQPNGRILHRYRSLATGFEAMWYDHEVKEINDE